MGSDALWAGRSAVSILTDTEWLFRLMFKGQRQGGAAWWGLAHWEGRRLETSVTDWQACTGILYEVEGGERKEGKIKAQWWWDAGGRVRWEGQNYIYQLYLFRDYSRGKGRGQKPDHRGINITSQGFISLQSLWHLEFSLLSAPGRETPMTNASRRAESQGTELNQRQPSRKKESLSQDCRHITQNGN